MKPINAKNVLAIGFIAALNVFGIYFAAFLPDADFTPTFMPATRLVLQGQSPYLLAHFHNPPWAILLFLPFTAFPQAMARGLFFIASTVPLVALIYKNKLNLPGSLALLLSPTLIGVLLAANLDTFVHSGLLFPPVWGLFILLIKPQVGVGVALYLLVDSWEKGGWKKVVQTLGPVLIGFILTFVIFPVLITKFLNKPTNDPWNRSIFPFGILPGLFFLWLSIKRKNPYYALAVGPLISPYTTFYSYLAVQVALINEDVEHFIRRDVLQVLMTIFLWTIMLIFRL
ncbi:MAG TPA: hypothetical protein VGK00_12880 [Anaerolineales bacterium]